jgi:hypothetical protein
MEKYQTNLEELVTERTVQLMDEKRKTETLLLRMLPKLVRTFRTFFGLELLANGVKRINLFARSQ